MRPFLTCCDSRFRCFSPSNVFLGVTLFGLFLGVLCNFSSAQNVKGEAAVGNGSGQSSSQMTIDATQFIFGTDMCGAIAAACSKLDSTSSTYPAGATIDARGFTGNQVCLANTITTMLSQCVPHGTVNATGGKLLLGNVNLYADGPAAGVSGNYSDGKGSGIGTPALIIPYGFWGIEGVSRGAKGGSTPGLGTFLSVCTGNGTPIGGCQHAFPIRSFPIAGTTVSPGPNPATMTITISGTFTSSGPGTNVYQGELVMVKDNSQAADNGTFAIQTVPVGSGSSITVTVPSGTPSCTLGGCGTLYLGTPIVGFGPGGGNMYNADCPNSATKCNAFGEHIQDLGFNCQGVYGCIGWQNLYAEENSTAQRFLVSNFTFAGFDTHGNFSQNFGPVQDAEIYTNTSTSNCDFGTTGAYIGDAYMHGFYNWTINSPDESPNIAGTACGNQPIAAVLLDAPNTEVANGHCETFANCVLVGANNNPANNNGSSGARVAGIVGQPSSKSGANVVQISANYPTNNAYTVENIRPQGGDTNATVYDAIRNVKIADSFVGTYSQATLLATATNCTSAAAPAACGAAPAGSVAMPTGAAPTLQVNTKAVTANSQIILTSDDSLGGKLGITCNTTLATITGGLAVSGRTPGVSFTISFNGTISGSKLCLSYQIIN